PRSSAAFDPANTNKVASADYNGDAWIWDVRTGKKLVSMSMGGFDFTGTADAIAFNQAGTEVAVGYADGTVARFNVSGRGKPQEGKENSRRGRRVRSWGDMAAR